MNDEHPPLQRKLDFSVFVWCMTALTSMTLTLAGFLFTEIAGARTTVAEIAGKCDAATKELTAKLDAERDKSGGVLVTLAEIKGDLRNIRERLERPAAR